MLTLWIQGYPNQALKRSVEALALARNLAYGPSLAFSLTYTAHLHQLRREPRLAAERAEAVIAVSTEHGLPYWLAWGTLLRGWATSVQGNLRDGIAQMRLGLDAQRAAGGEDQRPYSLTLLADSYWRAGDEKAALGMLEEARAIVEQSGEHCYEAELYRLAGIYLAGGAGKDGTAPECDDEAVDCFHRAIARAHRQGARALELRAASDLARLLQRQGKTAEATQALFDVYACFTEGFDTSDLQEAKALLDALGAHAG
ncbi:hypothetical protein [Burkholderia puraquae]|uniref:hypothetical protein n=1 Tax=Burkholderia puraquae TaxID=1904757 RepID=UPI001FCA7198|nr:hypothetical protein [Burkholderia puraquae]